MSEVLVSLDPYARGIGWVVLVVIALVVVNRTMELIIEAALEVVDFVWRRR